MATAKKTKKTKAPAAPLKPKKKMGRPKGAMPLEEVLYLRMSTEIRAELTEAMVIEGGSILTEWCRVALRREAARVRRAAAAEGTPALDSAAKRGADQE